MVGFCRGSAAVKGAYETFEVSGLLAEPAEFGRVEICLANGLLDVAPPCLSAPGFPPLGHPSALLESFALACAIYIGCDILDPGAA